MKGSGNRVGPSATGIGKANPVVVEALNQGGELPQPDDISRRPGRGGKPDFPVKSLKRGETDMGDGILTGGKDSPQNVGAGPVSGSVQSTGGLGAEPPEALALVLSEVGVMPGGGEHASKEEPGGRLPGFAPALFEEAKSPLNREEAPDGDLLCGSALQSVVATNTFGLGGQPCGGGARAHGAPKSEWCEKRQ